MLRLQYVRKKDQLVALNWTNKQGQIFFLFWWQSIYFQMSLFMARRVEYVQIYSIFMMIDDATLSWNF